MKTNYLLLFIFLAFASVTLAQENPPSDKKIQKEDIYTPLKPSDGQPAVFNSREELNSKKQDKKDKTIALIKENESDPVKVKTYREQLWRFENAIVIEPKK